jgi:hypothetical protein
MAWYDKLYDALSGGFDTSGLDSAMMEAGATTLPSYLPTDYSNLDAAMMAAGSTNLPYGDASSGTPFYLRPGFLQGAGSAIGGLSQAYAGSRAAGAQVDAADRAAALQERNYNSMAARNQGAETLGNLARNRYGELVGLGPNTNAMGYGSAVQPFDMSKFQADPGYEYRLAESQKAEDRIASRNRNLFGSAALANAQRNRQGMASQEFGNAYNRYRQNRQDQLDPLMYAMTGGTNATNATNTAMGNYGTNVGNLMSQAGQATGAGYLGAGNSVNNLFSALNQQYNTNQMMDILDRSRRSSYAPIG